MSKFYFNETSIKTAGAKLNSELVDKVVFTLNNVNLTLYSSDEFTLDYAIRNINEEKSKLMAISEKIGNGASVLSNIAERVDFFEKLTVSDIYSDAIDFIENNQQYRSLNNVFREYNSRSAHFADKYCNNIALIAASIKTAFAETIKGGSYEEYLVKKTVKQIISKAANDYSISIPGSDFLNGMCDVEKGMAIFSEKYEDSPLLKLYKEAKFDVNILNELMKDYDKNMEYLNSLERSYKSLGYNEKTISKVMNEIRDDFNHKYLYAAQEMGKMGAESLITAGIRNTPIGKAVLLSLDCMELLDTDSDSKMTYAAVTGYEQNMLNSYTELAKKIHNGDFTMQEMNDYINMFEICKNMEITKYEAALDFVLPEDKDICNDAISYYQKIKL